MAKGTLIILFLLAIIASLLIGINIGKKLTLSLVSNPQLTTYNLQLSPSPTTYNLQLTANPPTASSSPSASPKPRKTTGTSTFQNSTCGFQFSYPGSYLKEKTVNTESIIFTDPDDPGSMIATTCAKTIPRPPVTADKIESIMMGGAPATLFHDQDKDKTPRDEVIVKHPKNGMEIIIAGFGESFQKVIASFRFF